MLLKKCLSLNLYKVSVNIPFMIVSALTEEKSLDSDTTSDFIDWMTKNINNLMQNQQNDIIVKKKL